MLTLVLLALILAAILAFLAKFATADGDFTLLSKGHAKRQEIEDKVVWITGASRGIGEVLAKQLASLGAKLILSSRNEAELERVKAELVGKHVPGGVHILPLDLACDEELLSAAVKKAESFFSGGVDYMIHNAAYERPKTTALDVTEEALRTTFNINVLGTITLTRLLTPFMLKRGKGHFVVMSSAAGKTPAPGQAVYSASKHAINGYFHTLRSEAVHLCADNYSTIGVVFSSVPHGRIYKEPLGSNCLSNVCQPKLFQKGIKVTVVCPGPIETSNGSGATSSEKKRSSEKRVTSERCAELTIIAATHGLKEVWISYQPVLAVMYVLQYMPTIGYWLMDKIGGNRLEAAAKKGNTYGWGLLFGQKKKSI